MKNKNYNTIAKFLVEGDKVAPVHVKIVAANPVTAAKKFYKALSEYAEYLGNDTSNLFLRNPRESVAHGFGQGWSVCWEEGPYEWAISLSGGMSMFTGELGDYSSKPEIDLRGGRNWYAEPYNSFCLLFFSV